MGSDDGRMFVIAIKIDRLPDESKQTSLATEGGSGDTVIDEVFEEEEAEFLVEDLVKCDLAHL